MCIINFTPFPVLETERLILRKLKIEDENEIFTLKSDEEILKFLDNPKYISIVEAQQFINKINKGIIENKWIFWGITLDNNDKLIGTICLWNICKNKFKADVGYELLPDFQGKGIMGEALTRVIQYGFENMGLNSIEGVTHPDNAKSIRLLERKSFIKKGYLKETNASGGEDVDMVIYELVNNG